MVADSRQFEAYMQTKLGENSIQIGGEHYKVGGEEHWDRAWRLKYDPFQYIITKWIERWRKKGGLQDLYKARHALNKYIEVVEREEKLRAEGIPTPESVYSDPVRGPELPGEGADSRYVGQDYRRY